jgi:hypothetical protein
MQPYSALWNGEDSFAFMSATVQSNSARQDDKPNSKASESPKNNFYPFILSPNRLYNRSWSDIKNTNDISFNLEETTIPHCFIDTVGYSIKKPPFPYTSVVPDLEIDTVADIDSKQYSRLKTMLQEEITECGTVNPSEKIIESLYSEDKQKTNILLNKLFIGNYHNPHIIVGVLHIISHFNYDIVSPEGPTMAIAAFSHKAIEVREYGVKCFENWQHKDGIKILENVKADERWLKNYIKLVISDLKTPG